VDVEKPRFSQFKLDHKMQIGEAGPDKIQYLGIYYECLTFTLLFPVILFPAEAKPLISSPFRYGYITL
jgi:hypothetical protein